MKHADLIAQMTLEEKVRFCSGRDYWHTGALERLGIPSIMMTDGPHGLRKRSQQKSMEERTSLKGVPAVCYPTAAATACSWDPALLEEMGTLLGQECRQEAVSVLLGPGVNIKRSPLCGRNFEYFSEDPLLAGELAAAFIRGVQSQGIGTSLKHYAANNQETRRMTVDTVADERTLREIYLAAFEIAVKKAQPRTVMAAYNRLGGEYCAENRWLLTDVLREEYGFEGLVVTDWGAENDRVAGLAAGQELEMPTSNGEGNRQIAEAVRRGELEESVLDERVDNVLDLILKSKDALAKGGTYDAKAHHAAARRIAAQSMVLMKNEGNLLPLDKAGRYAVIGEMAKKPRYQGAGSSLINPIRLDTAFDTMAKAGISFTYAPGYSTRKKDKKSGAEYIREAEAAARGKDAVVLFLGLTDEFESEGFDRAHLRIPEQHRKLLEAVSRVNENVAVVLAGGGAVEIPWECRAKSILNSYLGGQAGGSAVVDLLFGDVNPSGKLAETYPISLEDTPCRSYFPGYTATVEYRESIYIGYRYYDTARREVRFPFGHGLSYTQFTYSGLKLSADKISDTDILAVSFRVKNTGDAAGAEVIQLYVSDRESTVFRPEKELKGFRKIFLQPGEEQTVEITLEKRAFAYYNVKLQDWHVESGAFDILVGASSRDIRLKARVDVVSTVRAEIPDYRRSAPAYYTADVANIPDAQFETLLGRPVPDRECRAYPHLTIANTLEDAAVGKNGARLNKLLCRIVGDEGMAASVALQTPVKNFISMSMGVFSPEMAEQLLRVLNDEAPCTWGLTKMVVGAIPSVVKGLPGLMRSI